MGRPTIYDVCRCSEKKLIKRDFCDGCYQKLPTIYKAELFQEPGKAKDQALLRARRFLYGGAAS